jgi:hypothetical protein
MVLSNHFIIIIKLIFIVILCDGLLVLESVALLAKGITANTTIVLWLYINPLPPKSRFVGSLTFYQ